MNYLAIDTSANELLVLLRFSGQTFFVRRDDCKTGHAAFLMEEIDNLLQQAKTDISALDFIACVVGPGSFTGIRIGVATVKALCFAYGKPALKLTSFDLLAYTALGEKKLCLVDAMHGNYYAQTFLKGEKGEPAFLSTDQIISNYSDYLKIGNFESGKFLVEAADKKEGLYQAIEANCANLCDESELTPIYVKKSQAEEELCK